MQPLDDLQRSFAIPGHVSFEAGAGGLARAVLKTPASEAHVYPYGAHVTHFAKNGEPPVLFMSGRSTFEPGKPIRGGVPICFPWFGPRNPDPVGGSPMHGFARILPWAVESATHLGNNVTLVLVLAASEQTRRWWPHAFTARYTVTLSPDSLSLRLSVVNDGADPFEIEEALHTYFAVADVRNVSIDGLDGRTVIDKTDNLARNVQAGPVTITAETDRVYIDTQKAITITDPGHGRKILNAKQGSDATVVWNPWVAKARAMVDFGDEEWPGMVCVETCNVGANKVRVAPGTAVHMEATISTEAI